MKWKTNFVMEYWASFEAINLILAMTFSFSYQGQIFVSLYFRIHGPVATKLEMCMTMIKILKDQNPIVLMAIKRRHTFQLNAEP